MKLEDLLTEMVEKKASDIFLKPGQKPCLRVDNQIVPLDYPELNTEDTKRLAYMLMNEAQAKFFETNPEMDLAYGIKGVGRFRVNIYRQRGSIAMVMRAILTPELSFEDLNLPIVIKTMTEKRRGLILVTGTTGCGKSTTLATMINHINNVRKCHIVTIEDPIEYLHQDNVAIISQREVGFDTRSFHDALRQVLRQSPDVILIGEMRDLETIKTAIQAAETGHLVLSTLHTVDAVQTVERIINYFPAYLHQQIRMELALCLIGVISQRLLPRSEGLGRIPAVEIMINTPTIKKLIHEGRTLELSQHIEQGGHVGMQTFNQSLLNLYKKRLITYEDAILNATSPDEFRLMAEGITSGVRAKEVST